MLLLDGKAVAAFHRERVESRIFDFQEQHIRPELAIVLAGQDKPSAMYASSMQRVARSVGLSAEIYRLSESVSERDIISMLEHFNEQKYIFGILMMMPLPHHLNATRIINCISPDKDVDGLTDTNIARLFSGRSGFVPCTPRAGLLSHFTHGERCRHHWQEQCRWQTTGPAVPEPQCDRYSLPYPYP